MRETGWLSALRTQTAPSPTAMLVGVLPTGSWATMRFVSGSISPTAPAATAEQAPAAARPELEARTQRPRR
jgi:hypothetical protein